MKCILVLLIVGTVSTVSPPPYIKSCNYKKADFNQCALENANYAIPFLIKGDGKRDIPSMNPLGIRLVELIKDNARLAFTDLNLYGLETMKITNLQLSKKYLNYTINIEELTFKGKYDLRGRFKFLDLKGSGSSFVQFFGGNYTFCSRLELYPKNGERYIKYNTPTMDYSIKAATFNLENLFDVEKEESGIDINKILTDNYDEVMIEVDEPFKESVSTILQLLMKRILDDIPERYIFQE